MYDITLLCFSVVQRKVGKHFLIRLFVFSRSFLNLANGIKLGFRISDQSTSQYPERVSKARTGRLAGDVEGGVGPRSLSAAGQCCLELSILPCLPLPH